MASSKKVIARMTDNRKLQYSRPKRKYLFIWNYYYYYYGNRTQGTVVKTHTQKYNQIERKKRKIKENKGLNILL